MKLNMKQRRSLAGWCFVSPWVLGGLVLLVFPLGYSLVLSFIRLKNNGWQGPPSPAGPITKRPLSRTLSLCPNFWPWSRIPSSIPP